MRKREHNRILWIIDRAHGKNVQGKQSPDGSFIEWEYSERVVKELERSFNQIGIDYVRTVTGDDEIGLSNRVAIANSYVESGKYDHVFLISLHNNASVKPNTGTGNEVFIASSSNDEELQERDIYSQKIAGIFTVLLRKKFENRFKLRRHYPNIDYKEAPFTVLQGTKSKPAKYSGVLIEFGFMDNDHDLELLKQDKTFEDYIQTLIFAIYTINAVIGYKDFIPPNAIDFITNNMKFN